MSKGGNNRDWGYASYDVDKYDDYSDSNLQYTSYEKSGSVNKYSDNGDGGHSHDYYKDSDNYNNGGDPDSSRSESNGSSNPSIGEVQSNGGCYLTTACMKHYLEKFRDDCYELTVLRWFRDGFISNEDIKEYYEIAPVIVDKIDNEKHSDLMYDYIYDNIVDYCVKQIEHGEYGAAYERYKCSILALRQFYIEQNKSIKLTI